MSETSTGQAYASFRQASASLNARGLRVNGRRGPLNERELLVLSLIAFLRIVQGDNQTLQYLPAWDEAMENWRRLYYCRRDDVVFDPQTNKTLSDAAVKSMLTVNMSAPAQPAQQAAASHQ